MPDSFLLKIRPVFWSIFFENLSGRWVGVLCNTGRIGINDDADIFQRRPHFDSSPYAAVCGGKSTVTSLGSTLPPSSSPLAGIENPNHQKALAARHQNEGHE